MELRNVALEKEEEESGVNAAKIGSHYRRYRSYEELPADALVFHEAAANATGTKLETLLRAIMQIEERLMKWRSKHLKDRGKKTSEIIETYSPARHDTGRTSDTDEMEIRRT